MSKYLLGFSNKKERDDFLIAILVILFFGWIMLRFTGCDKKESLITDKDSITNITTVVDDGMNKTRRTDSDKDGIYDYQDKCPTIAGVKENDGCPKEKTDKKDSDGDGVIDAQDKCPTTAGSKRHDGCPADRDGDGILDVSDKCPFLKGIAENNGCPKGYDANKLAAVDTDGDGINDNDDKCPALAGIATNNGCPADTDGDGVYDKADKCPNQKGLSINNGCPEAKDSDGDGVNDSVDKCPQLAGVVGNNGCPADADGDGVYDQDDKCPSKKGTAANNGCPEVKVEAKEAQLLKEAIQGVEFRTASADLRTASKLILRKIIALLKKYPEYKISIIGHTDDVGNDVGNLKLSEARAESCAKYLIRKGINASRITHKGKGETEPIATNDTKEGRSENRRVEFKLSY